MMHKGTLPLFEKLIKLGIESLRLRDTRAVWNTFPTALPL
jgi:hypothetical protein